MKAEEQERNSNSEENAGGSVGLSDMMKEEVENLVFESSDIRKILDVDSDRKVVVYSVLGFVRRLVSRCPEGEDVEGRRRGGSLINSNENVSSSGGGGGLTPALVPSTSTSPKGTAAPATKRRRRAPASSASPAIASTGGAVPTWKCETCGGIPFNRKDGLKRHEESAKHRNNVALSET
ncbi:uncharacterized protein JCM6883_001686 [Sporobolomyces salmoneus]|uniref:uncharacterized protein n=1 Tax=Sporobolomyces salmoneus TaxID=183962 RepID=UPI003170D7CF